jgi:hypothetical protein
MLVIRHCANLAVDHDMDFGYFVSVYKKQKIASMFPYQDGLSKKLGD